MPREHFKRIVDNTDINLAETFKKAIKDSEEARISTGYFYVSGFNLIKEDLDNLLDPHEADRAPLRVMMGATKTDFRTKQEIEEGKSLKEKLKQQINQDIDQLNNAEVKRLDRLREFIAEGYVEVRVRNPENGIFHAKGACFRGVPKDRGERPPVTVVGSSNFSKTGHTENIELNLTSESDLEARAFEEWFDSQWANSQEFDEDLLEIIENNEKYQEWEEQQKETGDDEPKLVDQSTKIEPFEMYKLLAYDELGGNIDKGRETPLFHFQSIGYESAREKIARYNGCIISDSVGLGKSFIGGELLLDYRHKGKNCLLIVPANLTDQWRNLLQDETGPDGNPYFNLEVDGEHLDIKSISKFQNMTRDEVDALNDRYDVVLIDEAHRFRNHGEWKADASTDEDYRGTRRHANLRRMRGTTMIMLSATPINNTVEDLKNLVSLFTDKDEIRNKANLDFTAFDSYIELSAEKKKIVSGKQETSPNQLEQIDDELQSMSEEISEILNEVMVLRSRKHVKDQILDEEEIEFNFTPPTVETENYSLPKAYNPVYDNLPEVMDALHLPHITIKNPQAGVTLKALYKLNLLKRLESSTYAFIQSIETLYNHELSLLEFLEPFDDGLGMEQIRDYARDGTEVTLEEFVENEEMEQDLQDTLEELGFDSQSVTEESSSEVQELAEATVSEVENYIKEDLTLLAYFLQLFVGDIADSNEAVSDESVAVRQWLNRENVDYIPDVPEEEVNPVLYPGKDLDGVIPETRVFYESVFTLRDFRDTKIDRLVEVLKESTGKVLVFTQYRATARYVHSKLLGSPDSPLTDGNSDVVVGGDENKQKVIKRFAPEASGYQSQLQESGEQELEYVVATDTLSEGVNLQDVDTVVNYDLPWNPMRIVQRVGRVDRIGDTSEKYVHNFHPDGDIEAAIKLLKRLQAKINDIALIVGKENNILDPNENDVLEEAGVDTKKTIGEIQLEKVEGGIKKSRKVDDPNELDDTSKNEILRKSGSDESEAFERMLLRQQLIEDYDLESEDFGFAEQYFEASPGNRELLYTCYSFFESSLHPGVWGLAHVWYEGRENTPPLNRDERLLYHAPFDGEPEELDKVRALNITPDIESSEIDSGNPEFVDALDSVIDVLGEYELELEEIQSEGKLEKGEDISKTQEMLMDCLDFLGHERDIDRASELRDDLKDARLENTDGDKVLRDEFREEDRALTDWDTEVLLDEVEEFIEEYLETSDMIHQDTLAGASDVNVDLICWGAVTK